MQIQNFNLQNNKCLKWYLQCTSRLGEEENIESLYKSL